MKDPMAPRLRELARASGNDPASLLAQRDIFSEELANSVRFVSNVKEILSRFYEQGARGALVHAISTAAR